MGEGRRAEGILALRPSPPLRALPPALRPAEGHMHARANPVSMWSFPQAWRVSPDGKRVSLDVKTRDFLDALDLFGEIGAVAEELDHHPDLHLEQWNRVRIVSYSHDVGTLSERDQALVARLDDIIRRRGLVT